METLQHPGLDLIAGLQTWSPALDGAMRAVSFLGSPEFYLLLGAFLFWTFDRRLGFRVFLLLVLAYTLSWTFKLALHQPRPYWIGGVQGLVTEATYGIPSGHATISFAVWVYLAWYFRKTWLWIVAALVILSVALSRLYLGVHFPHDILFGWLLGGVAAWIVAVGGPPVATWARRRSLTVQIGAGIGASLVVVLIGWLTPRLIADIVDPPAWAAYAVQARSPTSMYAAAGLLFGALVGYALMRRYADFDAGGAWPRRIGRYLLGMAGVLGMVALAGGGLAAYLPAAVLAFWISFVAPWLFLKFRLAAPASA